MEDAQQASHSTNPAKLFIGNLAYSVTEDELREIFGQHGELVDVAVITDRFSGRPKGMAFIEYANAEQAEAAIAALHEQELAGRNMIVAVAKPKTEGGPRRSGGGYGGNRGGHGGGRGGYNNGRSSGGYNRGGGRGGYGNNDGGGYGGGRY